MRDWSEAAGRFSLWSQFCGSRRRDGIEMVMQEMSDGTRAGQRGMEEAALVSRAGGQALMIHGSILGKESCSQEVCMKGTEDAPLYVTRYETF